jgi:hypothetical protein
MKSNLPTTNVPRPFMRSFIGIAACTLVIAGCASGTKIGQSSLGSVYLEEVSDWSYEANHPAVIDQLTISKIVKGLYHNDDMNGSSKMSAGGSTPMRIFSDEDAEFLAPLLAQGLSKAKPEQIVGFRVSSSAGSGVEPTTGSIYVQKESIYLTIRKGIAPTGFMPESVARFEPAQAYVAGGTRGAMTMVIDYHALATAPMPTSMPMAKATPIAPPITPVAPMPVMRAVATVPVAAQAVSSSAAEDQLLAQKLSDMKAVKDTLAKKDSEIKMLRKESDWMKRELRDRNEEITALRLTKVSSKPAPKKKSAHATRTR